MAYVTGFIIAYSQNIDFATSTDSVGWVEMPISNKIKIYLAKGKSYQVISGGHWREETMLNKPTNLDATHTFYGGAGGIAGDHAVNVCGYIQPNSGKVEIQIQNIYTDTVSCDISWWAYIVEILP